MRTIRLQRRHGYDDPAVVLVDRITHFHSVSLDSSRPPGTRVYLDSGATLEVATPRETVEQLIAAATAPATPTGGLHS